MIFAVLDLSEKIWKIDQVGNPSGVAIGFDSEDPSFSELSEVSFGWNFNIFGEEDSKKHYFDDEPSSFLISEGYVSSDPIYTNDKDECLLSVWAVVDGSTYTANVEWVSNIEPSPYPSWSWDKYSRTWLPPVSMPNEEKAYKWDEESLSWTEL